MGDADLLLPASAIHSMRAHVERWAPEEACGLLSGVGRSVLEVHPVENAEHSPVRFRMAPAEQIGAMLAMERQGRDLLAIYHSHPQGPSMPSPTDLAEAAYPVPNFIWFREGGEWGARLFLLETGSCRELDFDVGTGNPG